MHFCETLRNSYVLSSLLPMCMLTHTVPPRRVGPNGGIRGGIWKEELSDILNLMEPRKGQGTWTTKGLTISCPLQWSGRVKSLSKFFSEVPIHPYEYGYCLCGNAEGEYSEATSTHYHYYSSHSFIIIIIIIQQTFGIFLRVKHSVHTVLVH